MQIPDAALYSMIAYSMSGYRKNSRIKAEKLKEAEYKSCSNDISLSEITFNEHNDDFTNEHNDDFTNEHNDDFTNEKMYMSSSKGLFKNLSKIEENYASSLSGSSCSYSVYSGTACEICGEGFSSNESPLVLPCFVSETLFKKPVYSSRMPFHPYCKFYFVPDYTDILISPELDEVPFINECTCCYRQGQNECSKVFHDFLELCRLLEINPRNTQTCDIFTDFLCHPQRISMIFPMERLVFHRSFLLKFYYILYEKFMAFEPKEDRRGAVVRRVSAYKEYIENLLDVKIENLDGVADFEDILELVVFMARADSKPIDKPGLRNKEMLVALVEKLSAKRALLLLSALSSKVSNYNISNCNIIFNELFYHLMDANKEHSYEKSKLFMELVTSKFGIISCEWTEALMKAAEWNIRGLQCFVFQAFLEIIKTPKKWIKSEKYIGSIKRMIRYMMRQDGCEEYVKETVIFMIRELCFQFQRYPIAFSTKFNLKSYISLISKLYEKNGMGHLDYDDETKKKLAKECQWCVFDYLLCLFVEENTRNNTFDEQETYQFGIHQMNSMGLNGLHGLIYLKKLVQKTV
ncbi:hypothetical protein ENBRE01_3234 [Enteropsectra breve]|nr:hypothetical protein ENBRE01_3234 [Enteropsectra breve]